MRTHTQCRMQRKNVHTIAWIPSEFAVVDKYLKLRGENGWQVKSSGHVLPSDYVRDHERDHVNAFASLERA
jgi:hypothetical protein